MEPAGLSRDDRKRSDRASIVPWKQGKSLVLDVTCVNTVATSHIEATAAQSEAACEAAEGGEAQKIFFFGERISVHVPADRKHRLLSQISQR